MGGPRIELSGGNLVIVFSNGSRRSTSISVGESDTVAQITSKVRQAIQVGVAYAPTDADAERVMRISASTTAASIHRRLHPASEVRREGRPPGRERPPRGGRPPRRERPEPAPRAAPRPTITMEWIQLQLRDSTRGDRAARGAASALHMNSRYVEQFLGPDITREARRTDLQRQATIAVFNSLYQIPRFRLYLSAQATLRPEFQSLQDHLTSSGQDTGLSADTGADIIQAADFYIRHYLLNFVARPEGGNSRYREEILQLPSTRWRLERSDEVRARASDPEQESVRFHFRRMYISAPMDADTLTTAALYLRRWYQEHPQSGRGRPQERIAAWSAPEVLEIPSERRATEEPAAPTAVASAEPPNIAEIMRNPNVLLLGASNTAGGLVERELRRLIRQHRPQARVTTAATPGHSYADMRRRVRTEHLFGGRGGPNVVMIAGWPRANDGRSHERATADFEAMITEARSSGALVVVTSVGPYAGYPRWSVEVQRRADQMNAWLRQRDDIIFVDLSSLGEGDPPRLRRQFDAGDHLHLNLRGRNEVARMVYQAAFRRHLEHTAETQPAEPQRNALEEHAHRHWQNLQAELEGAMRSGRPQAVVTIIQSIPQEAAALVTAGGSNMNILERALLQLNRSDLNNAFDNLFNTVLHNRSGTLGREFMAWCESREEFRGVARASVRLTAQSSAADRRVVVRAVQSYLNHIAGSTGDVQQRYGQDLDLLMRQVFHASGNRLDINGRVDPQTVAAMSLFSWRMSNRSRPVGHWARGLTGVQQPAQTQPATPQTRPDDSSRRRVLQGI